MADDDITAVDPRPSKATPVEPGDPVQAESVTGRPNDLEVDDEAVPNSTFGTRKAGDDGRAKASNAHPGNSSFAERAKLRQASEKRIASASNKAVQADDAEAKTTRKRK